MKHLVKHVYTYVFGLVVVVIVVYAAASVGHPKSAIEVSPSSGPEGTQIAVTYPKEQKLPQGPLSVQFFDSGAHGFYAAQSGGGIYMAYDPTTGLKYKAEAIAASDTPNTFSATVPSGICGLIVQSAQDVSAPPKTLGVALIDQSGKEVPGGEGYFDLKCDKYTLKVKITSSKDPVLPDGKDQSTVTGTFSVTGPAQFINGQRIKAGEQKPTITTPLGLMMVHFTTDLGVLVPNPANVKTDLAGQASVDISSNEAGIATVRTIAEGVGDASIKVHFPPKITGVQQVFVPPTSPTNYTLATIPNNAKDLTIDWKFIPGAGAACGHLTGAASGPGLLNNGFYHGPSDGFPNGCDETYEFASQIQVTVTDKDGQSETKTFGARAFEGQGMVKLP